MKLHFSIIVPVYNRPQEIDELLDSIVEQDFKENFDVWVIEDGSTIICEEVVKSYQEKLTIHYFKKENSGPGASRNIGMQKATGNYFIILDSDVLLPKYYLSEVNIALQDNYTDGFGGPDAAHDSFTTLQKAINYSMTSFLTTGGIRGKKKAVNKFQPRSFNMGISKEVFEVTQGFSDMRTGEDIDLTFRLWKAGFKTQLIEKAFVYHKRRTTLSQFFKQTYSFGSVRPILNRKYPKSVKLSYWFPSLFILGFDISILLVFFGYWQLIGLYGLYFFLVLADAIRQTKNIVVAFLSIITSFIQFLGYGLGFLNQVFRKEF